MSINNEQERVICYHCGEECGEDYITIDGQTYCRDCVDNLFNWCEHCEEYTRDELTAVYVRGNYYGTHTEYWCGCCVERDATLCADCEDFYENDLVHEVRGGHFVCESCLESEYYYCDDCEEYVPACDYDTEADCCEECASKGYIARYHGADAAARFFYADGESGRFCGMGFELEIDRKAPSAYDEKQCVSALRDLLGERAVYERDGSLHYGFEIVTRPHTFRAFDEDFPIDEVLKICRDNGYLSHDANTCGLHIHISRAYFGKTETAQERAIGKCLAFYDTYFCDMVKASRRTLDNADRWASKVPVDGMKDARKKAKASNYENSRYSAVNTRNAATVEFRLMRGTLNPATFRACVDLVRAIARNAKRVAWDIATTNPARMLDGIAPATVEYLQTRRAFVGYLADIKTRKNDEGVK